MPLMIWLALAAAIILVGGGASMSLMTVSEKLAEPVAMASADAVQYAGIALAFMIVVVAAVASYRFLVK
jgi:hypothetical protein